MAELKDNERMTAASFWGKKQWIFQGILLLMFAAGFGIRMFDLTDLPLDFHPTRQLRSAIIARAMYYEMHPNPDAQFQKEAIQASNSLEAYEPPILESLTALTYLAAGGEKLWIARIYSSLFWIIGGVFLFLILRRWKLRDGALIGLGIYLFAPFLVQASRSFQPDPSTVMWILIFVYALDRYCETPGWKWAALVGIVGGMGTLVKVTAGLFIGGALALGLLSQFGFRRTLRNGRTWLVLACIGVPSIIYYGLLIGGRSGGFFASWTVSLLHLLIEHTFYADWLHMLDSLFSLAVVIIALAGVFLLEGRQRWITLGLWLGYLLYGFTSPYQFITHTYYHLPMAILVGIGVSAAADLVFKKLSAGNLIPKVAVLIILAAFSGYYLWISRSVLVVDNYRSEPYGWEKIRAALPTDGPVIALTQDYGNRLMYFSRVMVNEYWPTTSGDELSAARGNAPRDFAATFSRLTEGKRYFLVTVPSQLESQPNLKAKLAEYQMTASGDGFMIYDLSKPALK
jgi:hypothetical protein